MTKNIIGWMLLVWGLAMLVYIVIELVLFGAENEILARTAIRLPIGAILVFFGLRLRKVKREGYGLDKSTIRHDIDESL